MITSYNAEDSSPQWSIVLCLVAQSCLTFCGPVSCSLLGCSVHGDFPGKNTGVPFSRGPSQPRDQAQVSHSAAGFFTVLSHQGSPWILEWVAYSFSRGSFQSRDRTEGLLHCRWILYRLSYQGSLFLEGRNFNWKILVFLPLASISIKWKYQTIFSNLKKK